MLRPSAFARSQGAAAVGTPGLSGRQVCLGLTLRTRAGHLGGRFGAPGGLSGGEEGGSLAASSLSIAGQSSLPSLCVCPLRRANAQAQAPIPTASSLQPLLLPSGPLVSPCTAARSFSLMRLFWLPGEWEREGGREGIGIPGPVPWDPQEWGGCGSCLGRE